MTCYKVVYWVQLRSQLHLRVFHSLLFGMQNQELCGSYSDSLEAQTWFQLSLRWFDTHEQEIDQEQRLVNKNHSFRILFLKGSLITPNIEY